MRTLVVFSIVSACAYAQSPLVKILSDELERNFTALKQKADPAPYFLGYEVTDQESDVILASRGSVDGQNHNHARILDITIRAGSPKFDNYRRVANEHPRFTLATRLALDDNPDAIRKTIWLTTDRVYRGVAQRLIRIRSDEKLRSAAADGSDDFSVEQPQTSFSSPPKLKFNSSEWAARLRRVSAEMAKYPGAINSNVAVEAQRVMTTIVTSEGTRVESGRLFARVMITTRGKASDGMDLGSMETFETADPSTLPKDAQILPPSNVPGKISPTSCTPLLPIPLWDPRSYRDAPPAFSSTKFSATALRAIVKKTSPRARPLPRASVSPCSPRFSP